MDDGGVSRELSNRYGPCSAFVDQPRHMAVECDDSPFAARPTAEGEVTARKIAESVRAHHPKYKGAADVTVAFRDRKETDASTPLKKVKARYLFTAADLGSREE